MREIIHSDNDSEHPDLFRLVVQWDRDRYLQVGIQSNDPEMHLVDHLYGGASGYQEVIGGELIAQLRAAGWAPSPEADAADPDLPMETLGQMVIEALRASRVTIERDGVWVTLPRRPTNRLIATLKKAGAAVFGRDEW